MGRVKKRGTRFWIGQITWSIALLPFFICEAQTHQTLRSHEHESLFLKQRVILSDDPASIAEKCDACPQLCTPDGGECACFRGFLKISEKHCQDVDECSVEKSICGSHGKCINTVGSFICRCQAGFKPLPSGRCSDINECALAVQNKPCEQVCTNVPGSFSCSCHDGYVLQTGLGDGRCADVNECLNKEDGCSHLCVNTPGSFVCRCPSPLTLAEDNRTCNGAGGKRLRKSPLLSLAPARFLGREDIHLCPFRCLNKGVCKQGSCHCPPGLTGNVCQTDIDECSALPWDTSCSQLCINTFGSFRCSCQSGYALAADQRTCEPLSCSPPCMGGGICQNGVCICPAGLTGPACGTDIDECRSSPCQQICRNTLGSFVCLCRGKWRLGKDGRTCVEPSCVPHCRNGGKCHQGQCICQKGYHGRLCQLDVNECTQLESPCPYACVNTAGSYQCLCPPGFRQSANRTACLLDPLSDQHNSGEDLQVMIEVVFYDENHSGFTRFLVSPVMATRSMQTSSSTNEKNYFPYQPLFKEHRNDDVHHSQNSILRQPVDAFRSTKTERIKTDHHTIPNLIAVQHSIEPSVVQPHISSTSQIFLPLPHESNFEIVEHFNYLEDIKPTIAVQTPSLPTEETQDIVKTAITVQEIAPVVTESVEVPTEKMTSPEQGSRPTVSSVAPTEPESLIKNESSTLEENEIITTTEESLTTEFTPSTETPIVTENESPMDHTNQDTTVAEKEVITTETTVFDLDEISTEFEVSENNEFTTFEPTTRKPKTKKKPKKKKKKKSSKAEKGSLVGNNLKVLNQILHSFGLEHHQGDAKQFDLIDFDEINAKQTVSPTKAQKPASLPVLKTAPMDISSELDCYYLRSKIKSRSHFYRDEKNCTKCVCKNGELRCDAHHCPAIKCDDPIEGNCCSYCPGDCVIDNQVYEAGETFVPELDPCRECKCEDGRTICSDVKCPALDCASKYRAQLPDDCCPSCVPPGPGCFWNQQFFYVGQLWVQRQGGCQACLCREGGSVQCNPVPCVLDCLHPQFVAGECCPVCENCQYQDKKYQNEETFRNPSDPCSSCKCQNGNITCFEESCVSNCSHPFKRPGQCCPECSDCFYQNELIRQGDTRIFGRDNGTCTECSCKMGEVHCWASECSSSCALSNGTVVPSGVQLIKPEDHCSTCRCVEGEITECVNQPCPMNCEHGVLLPGACCIQCLMCDYEGTVYRNLQRFRSQSNSCLECVCFLGTVVCEENVCMDEESDEDYDEAEWDEEE